MRWYVKYQFPQPPPKMMVMESQESRVPTIFIVPLMQFIVGVLLFVALLHSQRDLAVLAILVLGVMGGVRLWSRMSLAGIKSYSMVDKEKVFPGEVLTLHVRVENAKFLPVWLQVTMPIDGSLNPSSDDTTFTNESGLLWYQRAHFNRTLVAQQRGIHHVGPPHIKVADLFGFFPRERDEQGGVHVIVYPRLVPLKPVSLPRHDFFGVSGAKSPVQDPIYILGTRDYQPWRPARYIHWKASARHNSLQEKAFEPSEQLKALFVVDVEQFKKNNAVKEFEHTLEAVASLAVQFDQRGYAMGFVTNGVVQGGPTILPIARNPQQLPTILEVLARLQMRAKGDLVDTLQRGVQLVWGASCIHFSYEEDRKALAIEGYFSHRKIPMVFVVCHPRSLTGDNGHKVRSNVYPLDKIRIKETERE
ncbi:MAG: DUF58 domain-containing protein [Deltaproteobacteria bacterium]|nr:DUF58 domain-containing protein [Deltaproteobacteria bacterium]